MQRSPEQRFDEIYRRHAGAELSWKDGAFHLGGNDSSLTPDITRWASPVAA